MLATRIVDVSPCASLAITVVGLDEPDDVVTDADILRLAFNEWPDSARSSAE